MLSADRMRASCCSSISPFSNTISRMERPVRTASFAISAVLAYPRYGLSAVAIAVLRSRSSRQRAASTSIPSTHTSAAFHPCSRSTRHEGHSRR